MRNFLFILAGLGAFACLNACNNDTKCTGDHKPGPILVTIDCVEEARADADQLGNEPLVVEYKQGGELWKPCKYTEILDSDEYSPATTQICGENKNIKAIAECGDKPGTFEIRAKQGARGAGPMEVTGKIKGGDWPGCASFTEESLNYELSLDVVE